MNIVKIKHKKNIKSKGYKWLAIGFWILFWEVMSRIVGHEILLASPVAVVITLFDLCKKIDFWQTIMFTSVRIITGFLLALSVGIILAVISFNSKILKELISMPMKVVKAMPMASFIILCLIWIKSKNLSIFISFLMVVPMIYTNVCQGLENTDGKLIQMANIFKINRWKRIRAIYIPSVRPHLISGISVGMGFSWKAGISAEVIGIPSGSIGLRLYEAKLYLMTKELFAWTIVIISISFIFERVVMFFVLKLQHDFDDKVQSGGNNIA